MLRKIGKRNRMAETDSTVLLGSGLHSQVALDEASVAKLAYRRWVERGCPEGSAEEDWFEAEKLLRSGTATMRAGG